MNKKTFKYRIYPNKAQTRFLHEQLYEACALYNAALEERRDAYKSHHKSISFYDQANQLKEMRGCANLALVNFTTAQDILHRVDKAHKAFFRRVKSGEKPGYPRFKKPHRYNSITYPHYGNGCKIRKSGKLYIQGAGEIRISLHRPIEGKIKTTTIKRSAGRWYASFVVEYTPQPLPTLATAVGIDVGLLSFVVLSDGTMIENPRFYRNAQAKLRIAQRKLSRRKQYSSGWKKATQLVQRAYEHTKNQRSDFQHKISRDLINRYGTICVEDLKIQNMVKSNLGKSIHDAGWGSFLEKLSYKAEDAGRTFIKVDPRYTSQICSGCSVIVKKDLSVRQHECEACGLSLNRDHNAAINILNRGLEVLSLKGLGSSLVSLT